MNSHNPGHVTSLKYFDWVKLEMDDGEFNLPGPGRQYQDRPHPAEKYSDAKFESYYRIDKLGTRYLSNWYADTPFMSTKGIRTATSLDAFERVSETHIDMYTYSYTHKHMQLINHVVIFYLQFCIALRYFATGACFSLIGQAAGVTKSTVTRCVFEVTSFLVFFARFFIVMPMAAEHQRRISARFYEQNGGKGMVLCRMDGSHFALRQPGENAHLFVNRKGYASLNAMVME